jgi:stage V sporulation protein D (sporulation-specific penicillin-binding protein)
LNAKRLKVHIIIVLAVLVGVTVFLAARILSLQTVNFEYYRRKVLDQLTYETALEAERGRIYDSRGEVLATNVTTYRIFISPQDIIQNMREGGNEGDPLLMKLDETISRGLSEICGVDYGKILEMTGRKGSMDATVLSEADKETADRVRAFISENRLGTMVYVRPKSTRYYIYGDLAANVIGFTGTDGYGLYGLEYSYEKYLAGTDGKYIAARDSYGNALPYEYESRIEAEDGYDLHTTLDIKIQSILEEQLEKAYRESGSQAGACGIVMNVKTGAVYAMGTYPDFDNNNAWTLNPVYAEQLASSGLNTGGSDYADLAYSLLLKQWSNKAVSDTYIPGSTFKIITTAIGLETASVYTAERFTCTGRIRVADYTIHCHNHSGHGTLSFAEGLQQSCNPVFITVGLRIGTAAFYRYFNNFGYLDKSGIDLPGEGTTLFWDENDFKEIDLATCAFGQNFKISPIRHLTSIAAVANGGRLVTPYIVSSITDSEGRVIWEHDTAEIRQVISADVCRTIAEILREGVAGSGGSRNAYVAGYRVAAKTGTSEKIGDNENMKIGSCVAFAPADDPEVAMIIMVDEPTKGSLFGSVVAAPYVSATLSRILPYLGIEPVYTAAEAAKLEKTVGDYRGSVLYTAKAAIEKLGFKCESVGVGTVVTAQVPAAGTTLATDTGKIILYVGDAAPEYSLRVPDVTGMSATAAASVLVNAGFNVQITGATNYTSASGAVVYSQEPAAGSLATKGEPVSVNLRYLNVSDDD